MKRDVSNIPHSDDCPICSWDVYEHHSEPYIGSNGIEYPIYCNQRQCGYDYATEWTEIHFCPNCEKEFCFNIGD